MRLVLDANVLAAALMRPSGWTAKTLQRADIVPIIPEHAVSELKDHEAEFALRAGLTPRAWRARVRQQARRAVVVAAQDLHRFSRHPLVRRAASIDPDDAPYAAAYLAARADFIWTRDWALVEGLPGVAVTVPPEARA